MKRIGLVHIFTLSLSLSSFYGADKVYSQGIGVSVATPIYVLHVYENTANVTPLRALLLNKTVQEMP